jgi:ABC-type sugar transport system, periplasmic component
MKKSILKVLCSVLVLAILLTAFTACGKESTNTGTQGSTSTGTKGSTSTSTQGSTSNVYPENGLSKDEEVTLKLAFFEAGYGRDYIDELTAAFSKKFPNVKFEITASPKIGDIINTKMTANDDNDMFDLFLSGGQVKTQDLISAGKLEAYDILDRAPYDKPDTKIRDLIPSASYSNMSSDENGSPYGINIASCMRGMFFDKSFFKQNGWNENPQTWSEFLALCDSIKAKGVSPIISSYTAYMVVTKVLEMAEVVGDKDIQKNYLEYNVPYYSSKAFVELHKRLAELGTKGYIDKGTGTATFTECQMMVIQHKAAMVPCGTWIENEMKDSTPEGFEWGFMTIPFRDNTSQKMYNDYSASNSAFFLWKGKPELNKKWAKEFNIFMLSMEGQEIIAKSGQIPIRNEYVNDQKKIETLQPLAKTVLDYYQKNKVELFNIGYHTYSVNDTNFAQWNKLYGDNIHAIAKGEVKDVEAKLKEIDSYLEKAQSSKTKNVK